MTLLLALNIALAATLAAGAGLLAERFCSRRAVVIRHGLLWIALMVIAATPLLAWGARTSGLGMVRIPYAAPAVESVPESRPIASDNRNANFAAAAIPESPVTGQIHRHFSASQIVASALPYIPAALLAIWLLGTAIQLLRLMRAWIFLRRLSVTTQDLGPEIRRLARTCARRLGLSRVPQVSGSVPLPSPLVFSIFRPRVLLPIQAATLPADDLEAVVLHELAHLARGDQWAGLIEALVRAGFWWCPLVTILVGRLGDLREQLCDAQVVACQGHGLNLAAALLEVCQWSLRGCPHYAGTPALGAAGRSGAALLLRIQSLTQQEHHPMILTRLSTRLAIGATGLLIAGVVVGVNVRAADYSPLHQTNVAFAMTPTQRMLAEDNFWEQVGSKSKHDFDKATVAELKLLADGAEPRIRIRATKLLRDLDGTNRISEKLPPEEVERATAGTFKYLEGHLADPEIAKFAPDRGFEHMTIGNAEGDLVWVLIETVNLPPKYNGGLNVQFDVKASKVTSVKHWGSIRPAAGK